MRLRRVLGILLVSLSVPGAPRAQEGAPADWLRLPEADLSGLEEPVAAQLRDLQALARQEIADADGTSDNLAEAIGELGRHYHAYDLRRPAEECYRIAARLDSDDFRWPYYLAYLQQTDGRLEEAAAGYRRALEIFPRVPPAHVRLGEVLAALDRPQEAERALREALRLDPTSAAAEAALGELLLAQKRPSEAVELLEAALEKESHANRLYYPLALAYRALGEEERARELLAKSGTVGIRPADPLIDELPLLTTGERAYLLRGRAAYRAGHYGEAAEAFRRAVEADPQSVRARVNLGSALAAAGSAEAAIETFLEVVEMAPANPTAHFNLGSLYSARGDLERAAHHYREGALYEPDDAGLRLGLAQTLRRTGKPNESLPHYERVLALDPANEDAWLGRAQALVDQGRFGDALPVLEEAHRRLPMSGGVAHALARVLAAAPDFSLRDGGRALELALAVYQARGNVVHARTVAEALAELGRCDEAAEWEEKILAALEAEDSAEEGIEPSRQRLARYQAGPPCRPPVVPSDTP